MNITDNPLEVRDLDWKEGTSNPVIQNRTRDSVLYVASHWRYAIGVALLIAAFSLIALAARVTNPLVIGDEYAYFINGIDLNNLSRLEELAPSVPQLRNYFFLRMVNLIHNTGADLSATIKVFNVVFFIVSAIVLAKLAFHGKFNVVFFSVFIALLLNPLGSYVAYTMPEMLYYLTFVIVFYSIMRISSSGLFLGWASTSFLIAVLTLVKPHGLFVFAGFQAGTILWSMISGRPNMATALKLTIMSTFLYAASVWSLNEVLAPDITLNDNDVVGPFYWNFLLSSLPSVERISSAAFLLVIYISGILTLYAPSITFLCFFIISDRKDRNDYPPNVLSFAALFLLITTVLIATATCYLMTVEANRIHFRYFSFVFPCLLTLCSYIIAKKSNIDTLAFRVASCGVWLISATIYIIQLPSLRPLPVDSPELFFSYQGLEFGNFGFGGQTMLAISFIFAVACLLLMCRRIQWILVQVGVLLVVFSTANWNVYHWQDIWSKHHEPYHLLGTVAQALCGSRESDIIAVGTTEYFVPIYHSLGGIERAIAFKILAPPEAADYAALATPGTCIITPLTLDNVLTTRLYKVPNLSLYLVQ